MSRARIHELFESPLDGAAIEAESFRRIDAEAKEHSLSDAEWQIARRLVHTTADFEIIQDLYFAHDAIHKGCAALKAGANIYADSSMIAAGLSIARLKCCHPSYSREKIRVHVADSDVAEAASQSGLPRAVHALRKARSALAGAIVCFGNSPVGLLELNRLMLEEGLKVGLVVAMPVGFVHVTESKEEVSEINVPQIVLRGRRGGSPLAVAVLHALAELVKGEI
jgi:precorrin isomerase